jgi:hypothetical protein
MREASPQAWERMARLYNACPEERTTEQCEAALAAKPSPAAVGPAPAVDKVPGSLRGRVGQGR